MQRQRQVEVQVQKEKEREKQKEVIELDVSAMEEMRLKAQNLVSSGASIKSEILKALDYMKGLRGQFQKIK